ncbi:aspartate/glutamate racemase family protein [Nesterenkonia suensis]
MRHRIGLLGGMSWHSTEQYYRGINTAVADARGGHSSASLLIDSVDFAAIRALQIEEDWDAAGEALADSARRLVAGGADAVAIATNLMHKVAPAVEAAVEVPLLHIADAIAQQARQQLQGHQRRPLTLGVLGTAPTMQDTFYRSRLEAHGIDVIIPDPETCSLLHRRIFSELTLGDFAERTRAEFITAMRDLRDRGAEAVVLGCTEIGILVPPATAPVPALDSVDAHVAALSRFCLTGEIPAAPGPRHPAEAAAPEETGSPAEALAPAEAARARGSSGVPES